MGDNRAPYSDTKVAAAIAAANLANLFADVGPGCSPYDGTTGKKVANAVTAMAALYASDGKRRTVYDILGDGTYTPVEGVDVINMPAQMQTGINDPGFFPVPGPIEMPVLVPWQALINVRVDGDSGCKLFDTSGVYGCAAGTSPIAYASANGVSVTFGVVTSLIGTDYTADQIEQALYLHGAEIWAHTDTHATSIDQTNLATLYREIVKPKKVLEALVNSSGYPVGVPVRGMIAPAGLYDAGKALAYSADLEPGDAMARATYPNIASTRFSTSGFYNTQVPRYMTTSSACDLNSNAEVVVKIRQACYPGARVSLLCHLYAATTMDWTVLIDEIVAARDGGTSAVDGWVYAANSLHPVTLSMLRNATLVPGSTVPTKWGIFSDWNARYAGVGCTIAVAQTDGVPNASTAVDAAGTGYKAGDILMLDGGTAGTAFATVTVATIGGGGSVATISAPSGGAGYSTATVATRVVPTSIQGWTFQNDVALTEEDPKRLWIKRGPNGKSALAFSASPGCTYELVYDAEGEVAAGGAANACTCELNFFVYDAGARANDMGLYGTTTTGVLGKANIVYPAAKTAQYHLFTIPTIGMCNCVWQLEVLTDPSNAHAVKLSDFRLLRIG